VPLRVPPQCDASLLAHPVDCAIRQVGHEMVAFFGRRRRIHNLCAFVNRWIPLISFAGDKSIKVFEPRTRRPNSMATIAEILRLNGYSTAQFGKCHEVPVRSGIGSPSR
jgi:hypothetical protein